jgi:hypothetical protein
MGMNGIDTKAIANQFSDEVTQKMAEYFETQLKSEALTASRRKLVFGGRNGKRYTYSKYRNTGQLASNIKISPNGKGKKVSDGTRANYSKGYHGMYFLVTKKGTRAIKKILKNAEMYATTIKL